MATKIERILAEVQQRLDEMKCPLTELDIQEAIEMVEEEMELEVSEEQNRFHCVTDWDYDPDPMEL